MTPVPTVDAAIVPFVFGVYMNIRHCWCLGHEPEISLPVQIADTIFIAVGENHARPDNYLIAGGA